MALLTHGATSSRLGLGGGPGSRGQDLLSGLLVDMHVAGVGWGAPGATSPPSAIPMPMDIRLEEKLAGYDRFHWGWGLVESPGHTAASPAPRRGEGCPDRAA